MAYRCMGCRDLFPSIEQMRAHRPNCEARKSMESKGVWNFKILLVITNPQGISTQILHYQSQEIADAAFAQLGKAPKTENFTTSVLKLYKPTKDSINYGEEE